MKKHQQKSCGFLELCYNVKYTGTYQIVKIRTVWRLSNMPHQECRLCDIWAGNYQQVFDQPYMKDENYMALVSIGAFVEGWTLIVPQTHVYSMRTFYNLPAFWKFVQRTSQRIQDAYGRNVICFEHGANSCDSETSCGTHHAHLHLVPFEDSLVKDILEERPWKKILAQDVREVVADQEYLLYSDLERMDKLTEVYIHILQAGESQYFRKMLAKRVGVSDYSYKTAPFIEQATKSFEVLR